MSPLLRALPLILEILRVSFDIEKSKEIEGNRRKMRATQNGQRRKIHELDLYARFTSYAARLARHKYVAVIKYN